MLSDVERATLEWYRQHSPVTNPLDFHRFLECLPDRMQPLFEVVQNLFLHVHYATLYQGLPISEYRRREIRLRSVHSKISRLMQLNSSPFSERRDFHSRLVQNCRDFALMLTGVLRTKLVPARVRCGFVKYFHPYLYTDHWLCQYYVCSQSRWLLADCQLDPQQVKMFQVDFDPGDVPSGQFISGSQAWLMCRRRQANPDDFGFLDYKGWEVIQGNVIRDLLGLNKLEVLSWERWPGLISSPMSEWTSEDFALLDTVAEKIVAFDEYQSKCGSTAVTHYDLMDLYEENPAIQFPWEWITRDREDDDYQYPFE